MKEKIKSYEKLFTERKFDIIEWLSEEDDLHAQMEVIGGFHYTFVTRKKLVLPCGASVSIQRSGQNYCDIRDMSLANTTIEEAHKMVFGTLKTKSIDDMTAELGFPNFVEERFMEYAEDRENPMDTVYGWVPLKLIEQVINDKLDAYHETKD